MCGSGGGSLVFHRRTTRQRFSEALNHQGREDNEDAKVVISTKYQASNPSNLLPQKNSIILHPSESLYVPYTIPPTHTTKHSPLPTATGDSSVHSTSQRRPLLAPSSAPFPSVVVGCSLLPLLPHLLLARHRSLVDTLCMSLPPSPVALFSPYLSFRHRSLAISHTVR
ncbi:hypothetical protein PIB30_006375 [Stylosanthes scabra]|uniref:Uncharacterized protein n=1 Tax=Stylosanthes scabra TaxID=79078 RepID=A0ABU6S3P4_9FABA|nr:hypothetical protein [Stylosanthes scabra]